MGDTKDRGDTVVEGKVVSGIVPNGLEGVVVQPGIITIKTSTSEIQKVVMNNVDLDILEHPVVVVDSFLTCLIIFITSLVNGGRSVR